MVKYGLRDDKKVDGKFRIFRRINGIMGLIEFMKNVFEILGKVLEEHYAIGAMMVVIAHLT